MAEVICAPMTYKHPIFLIQCIYRYIMIPVMKLSLHSTAGWIESVCCARIACISVYYSMYQYKYIIIHS